MYFHFFENIHRSRSGHSFCLYFFFFFTYLQVHWFFFNALFNLLWILSGECFIWTLQYSVFSSRILIRSFFIVSILQMTFYTCSFIIIIIIFFFVLDHIYNSYSGLFLLIKQLNCPNVGFYLLLLLIMVLIFLFLCVSGNILFYTGYFGWHAIENLGSIFLWWVLIFVIEGS